MELKHELKSTIKCAKELVENLIKGKRERLRKEHFFAFSVSKFILLKEKIIIKTGDKEFYFDDIKNKKYIPAILLLANEIKKHIKSDEDVVKNTEIINFKSGKENIEHKEAIWYFNKIRDSLAHGQYSFD